MIVSTMNSKEKAAKAPVIFALLEERVIGFLDRNEKKIYKNKKTEVVLKRSSVLEQKVSGTSKLSVTNRARVNAISIIPGIINIDKFNRIF